MKKIIYLILAMLLSSATTYSQLKVNSNGSVRMPGSMSFFSAVYVGDSLADSYSYRYGSTRGMSCMFPPSELF